MEINDILNILSLTQSEIDALGTLDSGSIVYNSTTNSLEVYNGTNWDVASGTLGNITASGNISSSGFVQGNIVKAPEFQIASGSQGAGNHLLANFDNGTIQLGFEASFKLAEEWQSANIGE